MDIKVDKARSMIYFMQELRVRQIFGVGLYMDYELDRYIKMLSCPAFKTSELSGSIARIM